MTKIYITAPDTDQLKNVELILKEGGKRYVIRIDPKKNKSEDPGWWYVQAYGFYSTFLKLLDCFKDSPTNNSSLATPAVYVLGIGTELYLKTFLLVKSGYSLSEVIDFGHALKKLREECEKLDSRFNNNNLIFVTDNLGSIIMDKGGIRYPIDSKSAALTDPTMKDAIVFLDKLVRPLVSKEEDNPDGESGFAIRSNSQQ